MANAFWDFSLKTYAAPGVADECLSLQDRFGIDVNLLLFSAYMGARGIVLTRDDIAQISTAVQDWHEQVVKPLRNVRRATKQILELRAASAREPVKSLRHQVKGLELESEKIEQDMLDEWARPRMHKATMSDIESAIRVNIELLLDFSSGANCASNPSMLIQAACTALKAGVARP
jgi:uncharacterized protein (TIGR02444 family)